MADLFKANSMTGNNWQSMDGWNQRRMNKSTGTQTPYQFPVTGTNIYSSTPTNYSSNPWGQLASMFTQNPYAANAQNPYTPQSFGNKQNKRNLMTEMNNYISQKYGNNWSNVVGNLPQLGNSWNNRPNPGTPQGLLQYYLAGMI